MRIDRVLGFKPECSNISNRFNEKDLCTQLNKLTEILSEELSKEEYADFIGRLTEFVNKRREGIEASWKSIVEFAKEHPKVALTVSAILSFLATTTLVKASELERLNKEIRELRSLQEALEKEREELKTVAEQKTIKGIVKSKLKNLKIDKKNIFWDIFFGMSFGLCITRSATTSPVIIAMGAVSGIIFGILCNISQKR